jgi:hypothetical protein
MGATRSVVARGILMLADPGRADVLYATDDVGPDSNAKDQTCDKHKSCPETASAASQFGRWQNPSVRLEETVGLRW